MEVQATVGMLRQNLAALGPRRLLILLAAGVLVFGAVGIGSYLLSRGAMRPIYVGLSALDTSRIAGTLDEFGIQFDVSPDGTQVFVRPENIRRARALLAERGLPASSATGYELFDKLGPLGLTNFMQEVTRVRALEGEIARTIQSMRGVRSARVHIVLGEASGFRRQAQSPSASVVVRLEPSAAVSPVQAIRHLVSAAVPGLSLEKVRVVSADGPVLAAGDDQGNGTPSRMVELERTVSRDLQNNIRQTLVPHLGSENFEASVAVRLNLDKRQTSESAFDPDSKVERSVRVTRESGNTQNLSTRPPTTVEQNIPAENEALRGGGQNQKSSQRKDEVTNYEISSRATTTVSEGYRLENITVAVVLNKKKLVTTSGEPLGQEALAQKISEIERIVGSAVGLDSKRGDRVTVSALEFQSEAGSGANGEAGGVLQALGAQSGNFINAALLIVVSLLIIMFGLRPLAVALEAPKLAAPANASVLAATMNVAADAARPAIASPSSGATPRTIGEVGQSGALGGVGPNPVATLNRLVDSDIDQAVAVLRRWVRQ